MQILCKRKGKGQEKIKKCKINKKALRLVGGHSVLFL